MQIGQYKISEYVSDLFRLDGGAMFGSVPKELWEKKIAADKHNRIPMVCRLLCLEDTKTNRKYLVDTGVGREWSDKGKSIYQIEYVDDRLLSKVIPNVTDVIITHLHFDHCAGQTFENELVFKGSMHYVSEKNWLRGQDPGVRERASYLDENIKPLEKGMLVLTEDGDEIAPKLFVFQSQGHTPGLQWLKVSDKKTDFSLSI